MARRNISKKFIYVMAVVLLLFVMVMPFTALADTEDGYWITKIDGMGRETSIFVYYDKPLEITVLNSSEQLCFDDVGEEISDISNANLGVQLVAADVNDVNLAVKMNEAGEVPSAKKDHSLTFVAAGILMILAFFGYYMYKAV